MARNGKKGERMLDTRLIDAIRGSWTAETSSVPEEWSPLNPSRGQCAVTAMIIQDELGGRLLRGVAAGESHYWNQVGSVSIDLTRGQFPAGTPLDGADERSREYVGSYPATARRYEMLRTRVESALTKKSSRSVYLAAGYGRRAEMRAARDLLESTGRFRVKSRWLDSGTGRSEEGRLGSLNTEPSSYVAFAVEDLEDIRSSELVLSFTDGRPARGGRHTEFGYALALGKRMVLIGPREHVFHSLPGVEVAPDLATWLHSSNAQE
jgi:hypothetical protein